MAHTDKSECETVSAVIVNEYGRALIFDHRIYPFWIQPGGHVERDEMPHDALIRELNEETGLTPNQFDWVESDAGMAVVKHSLEDPSLIRPYTFDRHKVDGDRYHNDHVYTFVLNQAVEIVPGENESQTFKWVNSGEIGKMLEEKETKPNIAETVIRGLSIAASLRFKEQSASVA